MSNHGLALRPHQEMALSKLGNGKILGGLPGTGKSRVATAYYQQSESPKDVYVITTAKKRDSLDWEGEFAVIGVGKSKDATVAGVLTVDSWNNLPKYIGVKDAFFIFDEQRLVGAGAWSKSFIKIAKQNRWILLSATPGDVWLDYVPVFIANGFYANRTEFKREHVVYNNYSRFPKVDHYIGTGRLIRHRNAILVEMPYLSHTTRHVEIIEVDYDKELFEKVLKRRWHVYENRPLKDAGELYGAMRKVANSDPSRLQAVRELMKKHPRLVVFYNFNYELEALRTLATDGEPLNEWSEPWHDFVHTTSSWSELKTTSNSKLLAVDAESKSIPIHSRKKDTSDTYQGVPSGWNDHDPTESESCLTKDSESTIGDTTAPRRIASSTLMPRGRTVHSVEHNDLNVKSHQKPNSLLERNSSSSLDQSPTNGGTGSKSSVRGTLSLVEKTSTSTPNSSSSMKTFSGSHLPDRGESSTSHSRGTGLISVPEISSGLVSTSSMSPVQIAEWNGHKHEPIPKTDRWVYLVQYVAGAEGWNCTSTDAMCFYSLTYSYKNWFQAFGRIDRLNTPYTNLFYYVLKSKSLIDIVIWKSLMGKESFNESRFTPKDLMMAA